MTSGVRADSVAAEPAPSAAMARGSLGQRLRVRLVAGLSRLAIVLPEGPLDALAGVAGEVWYRLAPERAALGRRNLRRVVTYLDGQGLGGPRVHAAATDARALEALVRATFRETARYYLDVARLPGRTLPELELRLRIDTPELVDRAFVQEAPVICVALHFGEVELPALLAAAKTGRPVRAPMETLGDPAMQAWIRRTRASVGVDVIALRNARRSLLDGLADGQTVGVVADRNVAGGVLPVSFFGAEAPLPMGPALIAVESGRPLYVAAVRRIGGGRYAGSLYSVEVASDGSRRHRVETTVRQVAAAMERAVAPAPEQWWSLLAPIWPDIDPRAATGTGHLEPDPAS